MVGVFPASLSRQQCGDGRAAKIARWVANDEPCGESSESHTIIKGRGRSYPCRIINSSPQGSPEFIRFAELRAAVHRQIWF